MRNTGARGRLFLLAACACLAALCVGGQVRAQTVSVDLKNATIQDITKAFGEQTGFRFQFTGGQRPAELETHLPEFRVDQRPLKEALREACERTGYRFRRVQGDLFWLDQGPFEESPYRTQAAGYALDVERLYLRGASRSLEFSQGTAQPNTQKAGLDVTLRIEAPTDDAAQLIYGLKDVRETDDTGKAAATASDQAQREMLARQLQFFPTPDWTEVHLTFDSPAAGAKAIKALEGTLVLYQQAETLEFRFDDLAAKDVKLQKGGLEVGLQGVSVAGNGCTVNLTSRVLGAVPEPQPDEWGRAVIIIVAKDGRRSTSENRFYASNSTSYGMSCPEGFEPASVVFQVVRRHQPTREEPFVIRNIPLP